MTRFLYGDLLWKAIASRAKNARQTKAAIAYVTRELPLSFRPGDVLVVDASDRAVASAQTSAKVLAGLLKTGVQLYSHTGLHAKIVVVDSVVFASSANLSDSSLSKLFEAGLETDTPGAVSSAVGMIQTLTERSVRIDQAFVARIGKIAVTPHYGASRSNARAVARRYRAPVTWLPGIKDIDEPTDPLEIRRIQRGTAKAGKFLSNPRNSVLWIRFSRNARTKEARRGDHAYLIDRGAAARSPRRVYRYVTILGTQKESNRIRLYYEDYEEPSNAEKASLSWPQFRKLAKLVGLPESFLNATIRQLSEKASCDLNDYWDQAR